MPPESNADCVRAWQHLLDPKYTELIQQVEELPATLHAAAIEQLRRAWPKELIPVALELVAARRKGRSKFPSVPNLVANVSGVEQATPAVIADHKAQRFVEHEQTVVLDLCSGIGGDAMSLARGAEVTAIDQDPLQAWMSETNARCTSRVEDVTTLNDDTPFHIDPQRRDNRGRRAWRFEDYQPGPDFLVPLASSGRSGAIKLGPGIDVQRLPAGDANELEFISVNGVLSQAVLWCGELAQHPGLHTATCLPAGASMTGTPTPPPPTGSRTFEKFLLEVDPAVERAGLLGLLCSQSGWTAPVQGLGLLTSTAPVASPWITSFEVLEQIPWRLPRVKSWLRQHDAGVVEVKTRDRTVNPDVVQASLRGTGDQRYTVFVLRMERPVVAVVTRRCE